jgi:hypothetical protein
MQNLPFAAQQEQVNKFLQANRVLGAQMDQMQGTTRIIYDTINVTTTTVDFFSEVASKTTTLINGQPATNITDNRFEPGEGMVIKELCFYNLDNGVDGNPTNLSTGFIGTSLINIYVGNNRVIKDLPLFALQNLSNLNNIHSFTSSTGNQADARSCGVRLFTNIVIPPQIQFYVSVRLPFAPSAAAGQALNGFRCYLKGYGKLFNPRNNY